MIAYILSFWHKWGTKMKKRRKTNKKEILINEQKRRHRRRLSAFAYFLIVLMIIVCGVAVATVYLVKIETLEISGKTQYSRTQLLSAGGIKLGERLFLFDRKKAEAAITAKLPFVESAVIKLKPFNGFNVELVSDTPFLAAEIKDGYALTDKVFKVLDVTNTLNKYSGIIIVKGSGAVNPTLGHKLSTGVENRLIRAAEIISGIRKNKFDKINKVDVSSDYQLSVIYDNRITIVLGTYADIDEKLKSAAFMINNKEVQDNEKGVLDVSQCTQSNKVSFTPS
jgi:cell division protein FtsQ